MKATASLLGLASRPKKATHKMHIGMITEERDPEPCPLRRVPEELPLPCPGKAAHYRC